MNVGALVGLLLSTLILSPKSLAGVVHSRQAHVAASAPFFEPNRGQFDSGVDFESRNFGFRMLMNKKGIHLIAQTAKGDESKLEIRFLRESAQAHIEGESVLGGKSNYLTGSDPKHWRLGVPHFTSARYHELYNGIDLSVYTAGPSPEMDFIVQPGADPQQILLSFGTQAMSDLRATSAGDLTMHLNGRQLTMRRPTLFQIVDGRTFFVEGNYVVLGHNRVGFRVGRYDSTAKLTIDPVIVYGSYFGGSSQNSAFSAAYDDNGNLVFTGTTNSSDYPVKNPLLSYKGPGTLGSDAVITKIDPSGSQVLFSTFLGGATGQSGAAAVAVDAFGNIYLTGTTTATDFPLKNAFQAAPKAGQCSSGPCQHGFISKIDPNSGTLLYSTYLSGSSSDIPFGIAVNAAGNAVVVGYTKSIDFPTQAAFQPQFGGGDTDGFVTELSTDGSSLVNSTFLGGTGTEGAEDVAIDGSGNIAVVGGTTSGNFPLVRPTQQQQAGADEAFVTIFPASLAAPLFSTYLGGSGNDFAIHAAYDGRGFLYVAGETASSDFPATAGAFQTKLGGVDTLGIGDAFLAKYDVTVPALSYASYLGGANGEEANTFGVDAGGDAFVFMSSSSRDLPTRNALQPSYPSGDGFIHAYLAELNSSGSDLNMATWIGGNGDDPANALAVDSCGTPTAFLGTSSSNLQSVNAIQSTPPSPFASIYFSRIGSPGSDFSVAATPSRIAIAHGQPATTNVTLRSCGAFQQSVQLNCSGAPANYTCTLASTTATLNGRSTVTLSIAPTAAAQTRRLLTSGSVTSICVILFCLRRRRLRPWMHASMALCIGSALLALSSCGGASHTPNPPSPGGTTAFTLTVAASSGAISHSTQVSVAVQ